MSQGFYSLFDFTGLNVGAGTNAGVFITMLYQLMQSAISDMNALAFTLNSQSIPVVLRKGIKRNPQDKNPQITVCKDPNRRIEPRRMAFGEMVVMFPLEIAIVSPNPRDWLTNLSTYSNWIDSLLVTFTPPNLVNTNLWNTTATGLGGTTHVFDVRVDVDEFLEPEDMSQNYDLVAIQLEVLTTLTQ